jgi:hypothetical protein
MSTERQREIIHDIANNFSVVDLNLNVIFRSISQHHPHLTQELERLKKAIENSNSAIQSLRELRSSLKEDSES